MRPPSPSRLKHPGLTAVWFWLMAVPTSLVFAFALTALAATAAAQQPAAQSYAKDIRPVLEKYCWDCHGDGAKKGDVVLDADADESAIAKNRKLWMGAMFHIEQWTMPPQDKKTQPSKEEREMLVHWLDNVLNPVDPANPDPGKIVHWGDQTWEEMNVGWFRFRAADDDDRAAEASSRASRQSALENPAVGGRAN